ncbi:hypothetical protein EOA29_08260 [Mesorhizobium sp. M1E.F.Ca.ET.063.01.1.1]|nr:hypothetical protein EOA29_08260 [Mesorhizobium sp. M1E.F.Ca.ET.063.01.1.1]
MTQTGSVTTQSGGNHAIQPYMSPGLGAWTVNVDGSVKVLDADNEVYGIWLRAGGTVNVSSTGKVEGSRKGVVIEGGAANVQNDGLIAGSRIAVHVLAGGTVENRNSMLGGVVFATSATPGSFINKANVSSNGGGYGVIMNAGGSLDNSGTVAFTNIGQGFWSHGNITFTNSGTYTAKGDNSFSTPIYAVLLQNGNPWQTIRGPSRDAMSACSFRREPPTSPIQARSRQRTCMPSRCRPPVRHPSSRRQARSMAARTACPS